jgi:hypothetical protein
VALNKRNLIKTYSTKGSNPKEPEFPTRPQRQMKTFNLLYTQEWKFVRSVFSLWLSKNSNKSSKGTKKSQTKISIQEKEKIFVISMHLLSYAISNDYKNLDVHEVLSMFSNAWKTFDKPKSIVNHSVFSAIKLLIYSLFSILLAQKKKLLNQADKSNCDSASVTYEKASNFLHFLFKLKQFLLQDWQNLPNDSLNKNTSQQKDKLKIYYTYRLTYQEPDRNIKKYYIGYRGCRTLPHLDNYYSSSKTVKTLQKKYLEKKILGIYFTHDEALANEVLYHATFEVDTNEAFLNKARQTTTAFHFDNTGGTQTEESNKKRSISLKGRNRFTPEGLIRLSEYQTNRERPEELRAALSKSASERNFIPCICPYCGRSGQYTAMHRWHFENCLKAPNPSQESMEARKKLSERAKKFNKEKKKKES